CCVPWRSSSRAATIAGAARLQSRAAHEPPVARAALPSARAFLRAARPQSESETQLRPAAPGPQRIRARRRAIRPPAATAWAVRQPLVRAPEVFWALQGARQLRRLIR